MKVAALGIALTLAVVLVACGDAPSQPQTVKIGAATTVRQSQSVGPKPISFGPARVPVGLTPMGTANIVFADGTQAPASCPICRLTEGESVLVQQNNYGQWVVLGKP